MSDIRKYINMVEAAGYSVQVPSLDGVMKRFKSLNSPGVSEWKNSYAAKPKPKAVKPPKVEKMTDSAIFNTVSDIIGDSFPDGDPIDRLGPWMRRNGLEMADIDKVVRKYNKGTTGFYGYLADMWDDTSRDQMSDAKHGHADDNSPFYDVDDNGVITPRSNPWR